MEKVIPVPGAAEYLPVAHKDKFAVAMYPSDMPDCGSVIQTLGSYDAAHKAAAKWQRKENKSVIKSKTV